MVGPDWSNVAVATVVVFAVPVVPPPRPVEVNCTPMALLEAPIRVKLVSPTLVMVNDLPIVKLPVVVDVAAAVVSVMVRPVIGTPPEATTVTGTPVNVVAMPVLRATNGEVPRANAVDTDPVTLDAGLALATTGPKAVVCQIWNVTLEDVIASGMTK